MKKILFITVILAVFSSNECFSQDTLFVNSLTPNYINHLNTASIKYKNRIDDYTKKVLRRLGRHERILKSKLEKIDSDAATRLFNRGIKELQDQCKQKLLSHISSSGFMDTAQVTLHFLNENGNISKKDIQKVLGTVQRLQGKIEMTEKVKAYFSDRLIQLSELSKYKQLSSELNIIKKQSFYYREQLSEYKSIFEDKQKILDKTIDRLKKIPAYTDFLTKNSQIATLFNISTDYNNTRNLEGLQLRSSVDQILAQRIGDAPGGRASVASLVNQGSEKLKEVRSKFPNLDNAAQMPAFKPNEMKTKLLIDRLEPGGNIQFQKSNYYFPTMVDLAGQIAYKFHKNGSIGIGASYRLGMGEGWQKIHFSHQGLGIRSFADWKLKGTFYLNGGFELTKNSNIPNSGVLKSWNGWASSALIGINRKQKVGPKLKLNTMLLYDLLASQKPKTDKIKIRIGYTL
ncbi:hypothetical protein [Chitinophaga sancti]|uniref:Uncharacterized protein n=1 Tax=Chitinophaga sancti TaxID=1004 RepID=A0A1K1SU60_9BACT|nr:hypothetical protein [Chitinophaga sancti]WQD65399.1 hypothetical protein U0033_13440 [Chitinophaga sancti]WQG88977.1 hypothetical protein SR876_29030 [Chitinophaga sancti]SFW87397.1 hypothetical protein SAMN05661012_06073 [Chitinophaga sancti]